MSSKIKKGICTNSSCGKYGQEITTHRLKFYCPECKKPLSEKTSQKNSQKSQSSGSSDSSQAFPWKGMLVVAFLGVAALLSIWFYTDYKQKEKERAEQNEKEKLESIVKIAPTKTEFQKELNQLINPSLNTETRQNLIDEINGKYLKNTLIVHRDSTLETEPTQETIDKYISYLKVFSEDGAALKINALSVDSIKEQGGATMVYITENLEKREK